MSEYVIQGSGGFSGSVRISGNKNAALPCLAASLLTDGTVTISNLPMIQDVRVMMRLLEELGSEVVPMGDGSCHIHSDIHFSGLTPSLVDSVRGSILFAGPLLARGVPLVIPPPGGDVIGLRRLDSHFTGLSALGVECTVRPDGNTVLRTAGGNLRHMKSCWSRLRSPPWSREYSYMPEVPVRTGIKEQ